MSTSLSPWQPTSPRPPADETDVNLRPFIIGGGIILALFLIGIVLVYTPILQATGGPPPDPASVARILLDPDPNGTALVFALTDANGADATFTGTLDMQVQVTNGAVWHATRSVDPSDFAPLPSGDLLAGRLGYRTVISPSSWTVQPQRGGPTRVTITVTTADGNVFSGLDTMPFP